VKKGLIYALQALKRLIDSGRREWFTRWLAIAICGIPGKYARANELQAYVQFCGVLAHDELVREMSTRSCGPRT
jgi:hypothetical protein